MKTLEEVKAHVDKFGYNQLAIQKIEGFLLGNGLLGEEFEMEYMIGERTFDDFRTWFNSEKNDECKKEIDWNEFGLGDFIHVQDGIDAVLLGGIHDDYMVCVNDRCEVKRFIVNDETRPCNEEEMESLMKALNKCGIAFCFPNNEFISKNNCYDCVGCKEELEVRKEIDELINDYEQLCEIEDSMSEDNPCKEMAKAIVEMVGSMVNVVKEAGGNDSASIDMLEIDAKDAIENIIANIHAGTIDKNERKAVINAMRGLVELGKMYE